MPAIFNVCMFGVKAVQEESCRGTFPVTHQGLDAAVKFPQLKVQVFKMLLFLLKPLTRSQTTGTDYYSSEVKVHFKY